MNKHEHNTAGAWAKKYHLAARAVMESVLRPYDLGSTQWYVLWLLVHDGSTPQRNLTTMLQIEKATLSGVVSALVRKGLVEQSTDAEDQRQKLLSLTPSGLALWNTLPDPIALIQHTAFSDTPEDDLTVVIRVLSAGTERLDNLLLKGKKI